MRKLAPLPNSSDNLGNLLQWIAGDDPQFLRALEHLVKAHIAALHRSRRENDQ